MSWIENVNTEFVITTGDEKSYRPYWLNASKSVEYNISLFNFINIPGTYADRKMPKGAVYGIEIIFQGEDHLVISKAFDESCRNTKPWTINHPFYGLFYAQPSSLVYDNTEFNVSRITGVITETITLDEASQAEIFQPDIIISQESVLGEMSIDKLATAITKVTSAEKEATKKSILAIYNQAAKNITNTSDATNYLNSFNKVSGLLNSGTASTIEIGRALHSFSVLPYTFLDVFDRRIAMFENQYKTLRKDLKNLFTRRSKKIYETQGTFILSGLALSAITNIGEAYEKAVSVFGFISSLNGLLNLFLTDLDQIQGLNGGHTESYIPDHETIGLLISTYSTTIAYLQSITLNSLQERNFYLECDSNLILLTSKLYGLDQDDEKIKKFITHNNLGLNEYLIIPKGRLIKYYI